MDEEKRRKCREAIGWLKRRVAVPSEVQDMPSEKLLALLSERPVVENDERHAD